MLILKGATRTCSIDMLRYFISGTSAWKIKIIHALNKLYFLILHLNSDIDSY